MINQIDKNTDLYCSFAGEAGSFGVRVHNAAFKILGINAIYKSFSVKSIKYAMNAMECLNIKGAAISMPFKQLVLKHVQEQAPEVQAIGAANTLIFNNASFKAYNTDTLAVQEFFLKNSYHPMNYILGNGGFSRATQHALTCLNMPFEVITRENWGKIADLKESTIINCTPIDVQVDEQSCCYLDFRVGSWVGNELALTSAARQFNLYTGKQFPIEQIEELLRLGQI